MNHSDRTNSSGTLDSAPPTRTYSWWDPLACIAQKLDASIATAIAALPLKNGARILDYGCGDRPYRELFPETCVYSGADLPGNPNADWTIDAAGKIPVPDESFDLIFSTQVLEHVDDPAAYLLECHRMLRPDGKLLLTTHGLMFLHPHPRDLWRWTLDGLQLALNQAGFRAQKSLGVLGLVPTAAWLAAFHIQAKLPWGLKHLFMLAANLFIYTTDRLTSDASRLENACVYALIAERVE